MSKSGGFKLKLLTLYLLTLFMVHSVCSSNNDYYTSITGLEELLKTEVSILTELQDYVDALAGHMETLQREISNIRREHLTASQDIEGYLSNPVNAYRLIKRLQNDWADIEELVRADTSRKDYLSAMELQRNFLSFPSEEDVIGAAMALARLQDTYQLNVAQVAGGILNNVKYGSSMSWHDCFLIGHHLYTINDFNHTSPWLKHSMNLLTAKEQHHDAIALEFMELVAKYYQEMGDYDAALGLVNRILSLTSSHQDLSMTKAYLEEMITDGIKQGYIHEVVPAPNDYHQTNEFKLYEKVCRGEISTSPSQQRALRCKYLTNNVPYRLLQPFKVEEHNLDPYIIQLYDVMPHSQLERVKRVAKPNLSRSRIISENDGVGGQKSLSRNSKSAWFDYGQNRYMNNMRLRLKEFSGLNVEAVEDLQVANYGIGGQYEPHWDFFPADKIPFPELGNRLATGIYYLSDVEEGGATAFPFLAVLIKPIKGSVLFWYNLHRSEDPDYRTKHAACPVLKGSKWIANIWVRVRNQWLERPCGLLQDSHSSLPYKDED